MVHLQSMNVMDFAAFLNRTVPEYAQEHVKSGRWPAEESLAQAKAEFARLLPDGMATENHYLYNIMPDEGKTAVGTLWFNVNARDGTPKAFIYDVWIAETFRRQGYGTQAFQALEEKVRELGLTTISLHVFGHNHAARAMYKNLGYAETNIMMAKTLAD